MPRTGSTNRNWGDSNASRKGPRLSLGKASDLYAAAIPKRRRSISDNVLPAVETRNTIMM
jgi:hypothetical protein